MTVLGLNRDEAAVYVHLSMMGPSKASDVAAATKLHRTETYRTLQTLVQRGFAYATLSRPARFEAAPPERLFQDLLAAEQSRSDRIQRAQVVIAASLATLRQQPTRDVSRNTFKILQGRREIYGVLERMIRGAERTLRAISTHEGTVAMAEMGGLTEIAQQRALDGLKVQSILRTTPEMRGKLMPLFAADTIELRNFETDRIVRYVIADEKELLMWVVSDPSPRLTSEEDVAIWTNAPDFVGTQNVLFELAWRSSQDVKAMPVAHEAADGTASEAWSTSVRR
ncbi:MAG: TrmB family transcriptional regulator [Thermoplasmatota archaeon]